MHEISLERAAERDLKKLSTKDFRSVISHIKLLARTPKPSGCRKITDSKSDWRIRVGDYRILYEINDKTKAVKVIRVRHRREAYR